MCDWYRCASVAVLTVTSPCGTCTIRLWCDSSRVTRTEPLVSTWVQTVLVYGPVDLTTPSDRGIFVRVVNWRSTTLPHKSSRWVTVRLAIGWLSDWRVRQLRWAIESTKWYQSHSLYLADVVLWWNCDERIDVTKDVVFGILKRRCLGAAHVEAGQIPASLARIVRAVIEIRRHRQVVCVDWQR